MINMVAEGLITASTSVLILIAVVTFGFIIAIFRSMFQ